jgi:hypothetical protein
MKNTFLLLFFTTCLNSFAQELPADSIILKKVFGQTDKGGITYRRPFYKERGEGISTYEESIVWRIVFKEIVNFQNQNLIFTIIEAEDLTQHGNQFGYRNMYFLKQRNKKIELIDSIIPEDEIWLGDNSTYKIADIGTNKKALIIQFGSTGNHHFEGSKSINFLEIGNITYLISTSIYDNSISKTLVSEKEDCGAKSYNEEFEIIKSDKEWFDIKIHHVDYGFTSGCREKFIKFKIDKVFSYTDGKYNEKKNN